MLEIPPSLPSAPSRLVAAFGWPSLHPPTPSLCWISVVGLPALSTFQAHWGLSVKRVLEIPPSLRDEFSLTLSRDMAWVVFYKAWAALTLQAGFVRVDSPEENHNQTPAREEFHNQTSAPHGGVEEKVPNDDLVETIQVKSPVEEESNTLEKIDMQHASPDIFGDKKGSDFSEGRAGSSSASGSDSDSESNSSDSGSDSGSHSRSRSKSPAGSGSGSSSDSESDASSSSKEGLEGSDEDVDIMSDDEKEPKHKAEACDQMMSLPVPVKSPDGRSVQNEVDEKQD
ncbi:dentin sialophosphoprotein-like, partial [Trifolium medium]|nr:dentin sialophosphoprotein-like [Trifolium medium]